MSKTISARIDDTMHTMITDEANQEGITVNEKLKGMINGHFNELNKPLTEEAIEEICKTLPKLIDLISQNEAKIIDEVNQRINNHESKYKHMINCTGLKCNSS